MRLEYFQLIDRVVELDLPAQTILAEAVVPTESPVFEGHFPGHPLMPGVLLIETMAQASGWLIIGRTNFERMPFLAAVKDVKLRTFVTPGQSLLVSAKLAHEGSGFAVSEAQVKADGKLVCNATITFRVMPFPNAGFRANMEQVAERIAFPLKAGVHG
jgi:3-hydroxyacyl-[acyl-carrier-protein] dehydratase